VGVITAFLTAYYMSRLGALAFFGRGRYELDEPIDPGEPGYHAEHYPIPSPHEPGWTMKLPLVVLAVLAAFGGVLSLPWAQRHTYLKWIDPVFGSDMYPLHESTRVQWGLSTLDAVIAVVGVTVAMVVWVRTAEHPSLESTFFKREWFVNELYDTTIGRPGARLAEFSAGTIDTGVIDGAVNGVASLVRRSGSAARRLQTGYVRNYVLAIVVGLVLIVGFMVTRLWWPA
jgi:NADH-quinone oxidoreductase subunit L